MRGETGITKKKRLAFLLMAVLMIPTFLAVLLAGKYFSENGQKAEEQRQLGTVVGIVSYMDRERYNAQIRFDGMLQDDMSMMLAILKEYVGEDGYTGPRVLSDGFVVELKGDQVILPEGAPAGKMEISRELIESSINSAAMRTGVISFTERREAEAGTYAEEDLAENSFLSFGRITDNYIYVQMTDESEFDDFVSVNTSEGFIALETLAEIYHGMTFVASEENGRLMQMYKYGIEAEYTDLASLGITPEMVTQSVIPTLEFNGVRYNSISTKSASEWGNKKNVYIIQLIPVYTGGGSVVFQVMLTCLFMVLIFMTTIVYAMNGQVGGDENNPSDKRKGAFDLVILRRRIICFSLLGAMAIMLVSFLTQAIGQLHQKVYYGRELLDIVSAEVASNVPEGNTDIKKANENWYVRYAEHAAEMIELNPELATKEKLAELSDILNVNYIMLFDSNGEEILSSNEYQGFSLDLNTGSKFLDFRRLLMGIPSIVQEATVGDVTMEVRQVIGVKMKALDNPEKYGALLMAVSPWHMSVIEEDDTIDEEMGLVIGEGTICFKADEESGEILNSNNESLIGKRITECGLTTSSLQEGYMDFGDINGKRSFVVTSRKEGNIYFYACPSEDLFRENLMFGFFSVLMYFLVMNVIAGIVLKTYNVQFCEKWNRMEHALIKSVKNPKPGEKTSILKKILGRVLLFDEKMTKRWDGLERFLTDHFLWEKKLPGEKATFVLHVGLMILLLAQGHFFIAKHDTYGHYGSLLGYLLKGDWMRGMNLFSICAILMVVLIVNLIVMFSSAVLTLVSGFASQKWQMVCQLLKNLIKYSMILASVVLSLNYLGVLSGTVIASLGLGSVALSLGAKELVTDVLAGIYIVFDETLRVGDMVQYDGEYGIVQEIGMRYTKLLIWYGNVLNVGNQEIRKVLNLSKMNSYAIMEITIKASVPLLEVEDLLRKSLPEIAKKNEQIIGVPLYAGVKSLTSIEENRTQIPARTLLVFTECKQIDLRPVERYMNREVGNVLQENGIQFY